MCEGSASIVVNRDGVEGACGGCEVLLVSLLMRPRSDRGRSCEQVSASLPDQPTIRTPVRLVNPNLYRTLPVGLTGSVVHRWCAYGTKHPPERFGVPWSVQKCGC